MSFRKYAEYKESGVAWLGEVPKHWEVKRLKFCVQLTDQKMKADREKPLPYVGLENIQSWTGKLLPIDPDVVPTSAANRFGKGMTLFGKLRPYLAKACNPDFEGLCSTELLVFKSTGFDRRLLLYLLLTDGFIKTVDSSTYGAKMPRANWDFIGSCIVPVPPLEEQKQIAAFLDKETAKIDALVEKQEQLITLLREKRQAIISYAVTRGLNPDVKMKDSGIEWLGEVPAHWEVKKLKYIVTKPLMYGANEAAIDEDRDQPRFVRITDIRNNGTLREDTFRSLPYHLARPYMLQEGDVLLARSGATVGKSFIYSSDWGECCFAGYLIKASIDISKASPYWFYRYTESDYYWNWISSTLIQATIQNVSADKYNNFPLCIPPKREQERIIAFLDSETTKIDTLIEKCETAIDLLKERRTALISAAVTGKIDVRNTI